VRLLLDINVLLDAILDRAPWADDAGEILAAAAHGRAIVLVAGHTITTIHYLAAKQMGRVTAAEVISDLLPIVEIVPVEKGDLVRALALGLRDYEDGVQAACALKAEADFIVTRDEKDFAGVAVPVASPASVVRRL